MGVNEFSTFTRADVVGGWCSFVDTICNNKQGTGITRAMTQQWVDLLAQLYPKSVDNMHQCAFSARGPIEQRYQAFAHPAAMHICNI